MTKKLQALWIEAREESLESWAEALLNALGEVRVIVPPRSALVMMQARDSVEGERFCVGELLVTECRIECRNQPFWGRVLGNCPVRALAMALLAAAEILRPEALEPLWVSFVEERRFLERKRIEAAKALGTTMVQFETMSA